MLRPTDSPGEHHADQVPPHSPELNPIENLWRYLKSDFWSNRSYDDHKALEETTVNARQTAALDTDLMKTICATPYTKTRCL